MTAQSTNNNILALVGLDGPTCVQLRFIETESTGVVFEPPPSWLPGGRASVPVPHRVLATVNDAVPLDTGVLKSIIEWQWRQLGLEAPDKPGWFQVDSVELSTSLSRLIIEISTPADALALVNKLVTHARRKASVNVAQSGELWLSAQALWAYTGATSMYGSPAEDAANHMLELIRQSTLNGQGETKTAHASLDYFLEVLYANGHLGTELYTACLQKYLDNSFGASEAMSSYLRGLERALARGVEPALIELECVKLLTALKRDWVQKDEPCPELLDNLTLSFREALVKLCEQRFDGDLQLLFWAKKQMVQSFFADPTYRKFIIGGMTVCLVVAAYVSLQAVLVMSVVGAMGYFVSRKRG